jgi:hypothetical protein
MASDPRAAWLGGGVDRFLWPDSVNGPYLVRLHWGQVDGVGRLLGVDLRSFDFEDRSRPPGQVRPDGPPRNANGDEVRRREHYGRDPDPGFAFPKITVDTWRSFSFRLVEDRRSALLDETETLLQWERQHPTGMDTRQLSEDVVALKTRPRRGPALSDEHYAAVADAVKQAHANGQRNTLTVIRMAFGGLDKVSRDMANHWRKRAQELGYLPPPVPRSRKCRC